MNLLFHHIGVATRSIEQSAKWWQARGYALSRTWFAPRKNVSVAFLEHVAAPCIELVQPGEGGASPVNNILKKCGVSAYHFCYETNDMDGEIKQLEADGFRLIVEPVPAVAFDGRRVCFLYSIDNGLIELVESKPQ
jgi:methylmalonyl-CoA/ethylmalonyl-CoA epimerase